MMKLWKLYGAIICISFALYGCSQEGNRDYNAEFNDYVKVYKEKYNIDLKLAQGEVEYFDLEVEECEINKEAIEALEKMEKTLDKFPDEFIKNLRVEIGPLILKDGIDLYIGGDIQGKQGISGGATSYLNPDKYTIVVNVGSEKDMGNIISHEIFHVIYNIALEREYAQIGKAIDETKWNSHNPEGFVYGSEETKMYTIADSDLNEVHFVSNYSRSDIEEDMAEVFAFFMTDGNNKKTSESEHIKAKGKLISNMIRDSFDNIGEEPYWDKLIKNFVLEGEYGVKIKEKSESDSICWEVELWNDGIGFNQCIIVNRDSTVLELPAKEDIVLQKDANFDGYNDILICMGTYEDKIIRYEAYIWDNTTKSLGYNESFKEIPNPQVNDIRKELTGYLVGDQKIIMYDYEYVNDQFVKK